MYSGEVKKVANYKSEESKPEYKRATAERVKLQNQRCSKNNRDTKILTWNYFKGMSIF